MIAGKKGSGQISDSKLPPEATGAAGSVHGKLRIVVTDDGVGLSEANQQRLFTEIVTFTPEILQAGGGSGFGLYISKSIVDLHKGTIAVASKGEGKGCTFTVELPMTRLVPRAGSQDRPSSGAPSPAPEDSNDRRASRLSTIGQVSRDGAPNSPYIAPI